MSFVLKSAPVLTSVRGQLTVHTCDSQASLHVCQHNKPKQEYWFCLATNSKESDVKVSSDSNAVRPSSIVCKTMNYVHALALTLLSLCNAQTYTLTPWQVSSFFLSKYPQRLNMSSYRNYCPLTVKGCDKVTLTLKNTCSNIKIRICMTDFKFYCKTKEY